MKRYLTSVVLIAFLAFAGCLNSDDDFFDSNAQLEADYRAIDAYLFSNGITAEIDEITGIFKSLIYFREVYDI